MGAFNQLEKELHNKARRLLARIESRMEPLRKQLHELMAEAKKIREFIGEPSKDEQRLDFSSLQGAAAHQYLRDHSGWQRARDISRVLHGDKPVFAVLRSFIEEGKVEASGAGIKRRYRAVESGGQMKVDDSGQSTSE